MCCREVAISSIAECRQVMPEPGKLELQPELALWTWKCTPRVSWLLWGQEEGGELRVGVFQGFLQIMKLKRFQIISYITSKNPVKKRQVTLTAVATQTSTQLAYILLLLGSTKYACGPVLVSKEGARPLASSRQRSMGVPACPPTCVEVLSCPRLAPRGRASQCSPWPC